MIRASVLALAASPAAAATFAPPAASCAPWVLEGRTWTCETGETVQHYEPQRGGKGGLLAPRQPLAELPPAPVPWLRRPCGYAWQERIAAPPACIPPLSASAGSAPVVPLPPAAWLLAAALAILWRFPRA